MPNISVVIPTYNRKNYLRQAINSCFAGNETIDVEVVIVDDGSTDGTREYLQGLDTPNVRPFLQEHQGGQIARNRGLEEAQGTYIKFLDDDDWLAEGALTTEVNMLNQSGADVSYAGYTFVEADGTPRHEVETPEVKDFMAGVLDGRITTHPLRFTYASQFVKSLYWDEELPCRQDMDFVFQAALCDPTAVRIPEPIAFFRQHGGPRVSIRAADAEKTGEVHAELLIQLVKKIDSREMWTPIRRKAAAHGLWTWAHFLADTKWSMFRNMYSLIQRIQPSFEPNRQYRVLSMIDKWGNAMITERVLRPVRRLKRSLTDH